MLPHHLVWYVEINCPFLTDVLADRSDQLKSFESTGKNFSYATSFPMPILMAAAFDDQLIYDVASTVGKEGRAFGNHGHAGFDFWTPNMNPFRDPRWGRGMETPGEDPYHISTYVYNLVIGLQGGLDPKVPQIIATCKHYAVYDVEDGRSSNDLNPTLQDLTDYFLAPFKTCARDAKVGAIMCSYNAEEGIPSCANRYLLQTMLREHWQWNQPYHWVTSDCGAVSDIVYAHHYASSASDAAAVALNAGTDLGCEGSIEKTLVQAVAGNVTTVAALDQSLSRLYMSLLRLGYFDPSNQYASLGWSDVGTPEAQNLAYQSAVEGMTLLKNEGVLPLPSKPSNVAVIGPWANATRQMQGNYYGTAPYLISPLMAMQDTWNNVQYAHGVGITSQDTSGFAQAMSVASSADYIIYCGGIDTSVESEGHDRKTITWPPTQLELISQLATLNKPLVVVQFGGGQLDDTVLLQNKTIGAVVWAGYPGQSGGLAVRDILDGSKSPAGRLPVTQYPANYVNEVNILNPNLRPNASTGNPGRTFKWFPSPVLPYGYGLHYTNFSMSWASTPRNNQSIAGLVGSPQPGAGAIENAPFATFKIQVKNTGGPAQMASDYSGLLFLSTENAGPGPYPLKSLAGYARAFDIGVGEVKTLAVTVPIGSLARSDLDGNLVIYPGDYTITLDTDSKLTYKFHLYGAATIIEPSPHMPSAPVAILNLGCYEPKPNQQVLSGPSVVLTASNTPQACADQCQKNGYSFSAVENGK